MKKLFVAIALLLTGCSDNKGEVIDELERELKSSRYELESCQNRVNALSNDSGLNSGGFNNDDSSTTESETTQEASGPSCEKINYDEIYVDNRLLTTCTSEDVKVEACGIRAENCDDGYNRYCLQNVKLKTVEKEVCE